MNRSFAICRNCVFWRQGAPSDMRVPVAHDPDAETGACEVGPASMYEMNDQWVAFQPIVHATRSCSEFARPRSTPDDDDPDDGGPGDGEPHPTFSRVHALFPVQSVPQAA